MQFRVMENFNLSVTCLMFCINIKYILSFQFYLYNIFVPAYCIYTVYCIVKCYIVKKKQLIYCNFFMCL